MSNTTKTPYHQALAVAEQMVEKLSPYCDRIEIAGSIRRERKMIGDIEIVALPKLLIQRDLFGNPVAIRNLLHDFLILREVDLYKGVKPDAKQKQFFYLNYQVDLFLPASLDHWGSIFTIRTGSHDFNMWLMSERCKQVGITFAGGLLYETHTNVLIDTREEGDVFKALQMDFVPPNKRDNQEWLEYVRVPA